MKQINMILAVLSVLGLMVLVGCGSEEKVAEDVPATEIAATAEVDHTAGSAEVQAFYFHSNRRCKTCLKIESLATKALTEGFADALGEGKLSWDVVNFEEAGNEHIVKDYGLVSQSVVLVRPNAGDTASWKNLDRVWELVSDDSAFVNYVQTEVKTFLGEN